MRRLVFRADGNSQIGMGHITRCLALAAMTHNVFRCEFCIDSPVDAIVDSIRNYCDRVIALDSAVDIDEFVDTLTGKEIVVVDGYHYPDDYLAAIKQTAGAMVLIDDLAVDTFEADLVINHAPWATVSDYPSFSPSRLLLGTDFALLRQPFIEAATAPAKTFLTNHALICFGGADPNNLTIRYLEQIVELNLTGTVSVITGSAYAGSDGLQALINHIRANHEIKIETHRALDAAEMAKVMQNCDFAIVPASGILFEAMACRLPVISGYYVDNQKKIAEYFSDKDIGVMLGDMNTATLTSQHISSLHYRQADNARSYIDGQSGRRLVRVLEQLIS